MKVETIEEYLGTLQGSMVEAWKAHLKTDKYSSHIALNEFYEKVVDLVDSLIEEYQGIHGVVKNLKNMMSTDKMNAIEYLESLRELAEDGKKFLKEDELKSDVDAILSLIDSTLYKLKVLRESADKPMRSLVEFLNESMSERTDEGLQIKVDKAVKDMWKHKDVKYIVIIPFNDENLENEIGQQPSYGPVATDCGKLFGIKS